MDIKKQLQTLYPDVQTLTAISDGWENEVYSFALSTGETYILRLYFANVALHEYTGMKKLYRAGYPVPKMLHVDPDKTVFGKPYTIMKKIDGTAFKLDEAEALRRFCHLFADLHTLDYHPFLTTAITPQAAMQQRLHDGRVYVVDYLGLREFIPVFDWLAAHVPHEAYLNITHGDFHNNNILHTPDDRLFVIDWTGWQVTDFRFDLAWTFMLATCYIGKAYAELFLQTYQQMRPIEAMDFFIVAAALRRVSDVSAMLDGQAVGMRPETVAIIKREASQLLIVYNLLKNLTALTLPQVEARLAALHADNHSG